MNLSGEDKAYVRQLMKDYLKENPDATPEEKAELRSWVMTGHSPYDNPYSVWGETVSRLISLVHSGFGRILNLKMEKRLLVYGNRNVLRMPPAGPPGL